MEKCSSGSSDLLLLLLLLSTSSSSSSVHPWERVIFPVSLRSRETCGENWFARNDLYLERRRRRRLLFTTSVAAAAAVVTVTRPKITLPIDCDESFMAALSEVLRGCVLYFFIGQIDFTPVKALGERLNARIVAPG